MSFDVQALLHLPSVQRFALRVRESLRGQHTVVSLGHGLSTEHQLGLVQECLGHLTSQEVLTDQRQEGESVTDLLARVLGCSAAMLMPGSRGEPLLGDAPSVVLLRSLDELPHPEREAWLDYVADVARLDWSVRSKFLAPITGLSHLTTESRLSIVEFRGELSQVDLGQLCQEGTRELDGTTAAWSQAIIPELAVGETTLFSLLRHPVLQDVGVISETLKRFAEDCGWTDPLRAEGLLAQTERAPATEGRLSPMWRRLWSAGLAVGVRNHKLELTSPALVWLGSADCQRELVHRVWRGQARLLLPMLDEIRLRACDGLTRKLGPKWPVLRLTENRPERSQPLTDDPRAVDFGPLRWLYNEEYKHDRRNPVREVVNHAWYVRNELAHYRPVSFLNFQHLVQAEGQAW